MAVVVTKRKAVMIAQSLTAYKCAHPESLTPMAELYNMNVRIGAYLDTPQHREQHVRVARMMGWPVRRCINDIFENGVKVWSIDGH